MAGADGLDAYVAAAAGAAAAPQNADTVWALLDTDKFPLLLTGVLLSNRACHHPLTSPLGFSPFLGEGARHRLRGPESEARSPSREAGAAVGALRVLSGQFTCLHPVVLLCAWCPRLIRFRCVRQMPGYPDHDTVFSTGDSPKFADVRDFGYLRSPTLLRKLSTARLEFRVFDDGEAAARGGLLLCTECLLPAV